MKVDDLGKWVKEFFKKKEKDQYWGGMFDEFMLCTEENGRIYKIKRYRSMGLSGHWEDVYTSKDGIDVVNKYEAILSKLEKDAACKRLENAKRELEKAERDVKKYRSDC